MPVSKRLSIGFVWLVVAAAIVRSADIPRPEFPEPQFERSSWLSLNGTWDFSFDDQDRGLNENWQKRAHYDRTIVVPYCFESKLSGIADTSFHPVTWYRRTFELPQNWAGKHVLLHFGAVD